MVTTPITAFRWSRVSRETQTLQTDRYICKVEFDRVTPRGVIVYAASIQEKCARGECLAIERITGFRAAKRWVEATVRKLEANGGAIERQVTYEVSTHKLSHEDDAALKRYLTTRMNAEARRRQISNPRVIDKFTDRQTDKGNVIVVWKCTGLSRRV